ncbi:hypothetical protein [Trabulsiella guamensis]|uniref:hypothetical protein n=1 Tax=Trabulsiella guamensis TaxID=158852 RepID=UPI00090786AA|nr:hypothetical protein [Trabulsiella guamensis]
MRRAILSVFMLMFVIPSVNARNEPCSGSKGGISHCTADGKFVCRDGELSRSKRKCSGYGVEQDLFDNNQPQTSPKKTKPRKKTQKAAPEVTEETVETEDTYEPKTPTCAPLYMAHKPGFTNLPICQNGQY